MMEYDIAGIQVQKNYIHYLFPPPIQPPSQCNTCLFLNIITYTRRGIDLVIPTVLISALPAIFLDGEIW